MTNIFYRKGDVFRLGQRTKKLDEEYRSEFRRDYGRLIHSPSFRRLSGKTQLFPCSESDFFRNRLTHSLEVAQIGKSICIRLNHLLEQRNNPSIGQIDLDLVEFACLAHDLGHPPFGHQGEEQLNELMRKYGGFEGNAQTLRILSLIEKKSHGAGDNNDTGFSEECEDLRYGLAPTFRALASIIKYDFEIPIIAPKTDYSHKKISKKHKGYYHSEAKLVKKIKEKIGVKNKNLKTIECNIMDFADDIAYSTYDLEDTLKAGFITLVDLISKGTGIKIANDISDEKIIHASKQLLLSTVKNINQCIADDDKEYTQFSREKLDELLKSLKNKDLEKFKNVDENLKSICKSKIIEQILSILITPLIIGDLPMNEDVLKSLIIKDSTGNTFLHHGLIEYLIDDANNQSKAYINSAYSRHQLSSFLIHNYIKSIDIEVDNEHPNLSKIYFDNDGKESNFFDTELKIEILKKLTFYHQIDSQKLKIVEYRGKEIVKHIFKAILKNDGKFLPSDVYKIYTLYKDKYERSNKVRFEIERRRLICDYIASMTDKYATEFHSRLYSETPQSIFKRI